MTDNPSSVNISTEEFKSPQLDVQITANQPSVLNTATAISKDELIEENEKKLFFERQKAGLSKPHTSEVTPQTHAAKEPVLEETAEKDSEEEDIITPSLLQMLEDDFGITKGETYTLNALVRGKTLTVKMREVTKDDHFWSYSVLERMTGSDEMNKIKAGITLKELVACRVTVSFSYNGSPMMSPLDLFGITKDLDAWSTAKNGCAFNSERDKLPESFQNRAASELHEFLSTKVAYDVLAEFYTFLDSILDGHVTSDRDLDSQLQGKPVNP